MQTMQTVKIGLPIYYSQATLVPRLPLPQPWYGAAGSLASESLLHTTLLRPWLTYGQVWKKPFKKQFFIFVLLIVILIHIIHLIMNEAKIKMDQVFAKWGTPPTSPSSFWLNAPPPTSYQTGQ